MSAQVVDLAEQRRVRELARELTRLAEGRPEDLVVLQHLMTDHPRLAHGLVRQVFAGTLSLPDAAAIARRWFLHGSPASDSTSFRQNS